MKVLIVSSNFPPDLGGPAVSANYLAKELIKNNCYVKVLTNGCRGDVKNPHYVIRTAYVKAAKNSILGAFLRVFHLFNALVKIGKDYDIILSQDTNISGFPVYLASFFNNKPYLVKFSGDLAVEYLYGKFKLDDILNDKNLFSKFLHMIQRLVCNRAKTAIATSKYVMFCMKSIGIREDKIKIIHNGIVKQKIDNNVINHIRGKYGNNLVCTASRLVEWKNVRFLIKALNSLKNYKLIIYGSGPLKNNLQKTAKEFGANNVFFYGEVPYDKIQSYIKACDYFALASTYEPFGIAILDSLIVKVPVIAADTGGMPEVVDNNGLIFKNNDLSDFRRKLSSLKKVKVKSIKEYEWSEVVKDYLKVMR